MSVAQQYIDIDKSMIPYTFRIRLAGERFEMKANYNPEGDFFTVDLLKRGEVLARGEKVVYGRPLFSAYADDRFPSVAIIPLDFSESADRIGWDELGESVHLYIFTPDEILDLEDIDDS